MAKVMTNSLWVYLIVSTVAFTGAVLYAVFIRGEFIVSLYSGKWRALAVLNFVCCFVGLSGHFVYRRIYGTLRAVEQQNLRDLFWNFAFYKFIFMFGVMNMQEISEMIGWWVWFSLVGMLLLIGQLCKDRFEYMSFSPNTAVYSYVKIIIPLVVVVLTCSALYMVCAIVGWQYGISYFVFLIAEVLVVMIKAVHTLICCVIHLWDLHYEGMWENHGLYSHYTDFLLEMIALAVDLFHHLHMILWNNFVPSLAGVVLLLQMKFIYDHIQLKLRKHYDYVAVTETLETRFPAATKEELNTYPQHCSICRDRMVSARKLPCGHLFHLGCLRSWLYQDNSCPLCRSSIPLTPTHSSHDPSGASTSGGGLREAGMATRRQVPFQFRNRRNLTRHQVFHFHGPTLASWLPSVSVELPGNQNTSPGLDRNIHELYENALHLHSMFPSVPLHAILIDLTRTYSVDATLQNIITGNIILFPFNATLAAAAAQQQQSRRSTDPPPELPQEAVTSSDDITGASGDDKSSDGDDPTQPSGDHWSSSGDHSNIITSHLKFSSRNLGDNSVTINSSVAADLPSLLPRLPRSSSFQERKAAFLEEAKKNFLQKHGSS